MVTFLGFHFDTINSAVTSSDSKEQQGNKHARGATGVIGIQDCISGGERVSFPTVHRKNVDDVTYVVNHYNPLAPATVLQECFPAVTTEPIAGLLSLFDGGDVLHGVSAVTDGLRVATVFLFSEQKPVDNLSNTNSANAFYGED